MCNDPYTEFQQKIMHKVRMPKALRRKPLAMFDGASNDKSALLRLLSALSLRDGEVSPSRCWLVFIAKSLHTLHIIDF